MKTESKTPLVFSRDKHPVSRNLISPSALKVLYRLNKGGFEAYLVGGGVRDILLGLKPKDFDIVTNATPEQIKSLFRNSRIIGRRFKLVHIVYGREVIEVATFRGHHEGLPEHKNTDQKISKQSAHGMLLRDNIFGSIEEDAERRDFTINALYYSVKDFKVYDFANGVEDINLGLIRLIGDPETRYREDPVRMLRAIRFASKLNMQISEETKAPIKELAPLLENIPAARLFEEFLKMFLSGNGEENFLLLREYQLLSYLFPTLSHLNSEPTTFANGHNIELLLLALQSTDSRIQHNQKVTPAFLLAAFLWYPLQEQLKIVKENSDLTPQDTFFAAIGEVMSIQQQRIATPRHFQTTIKDILILQDKLLKRDKKRAYITLAHPKFRAAYDFLLLRAKVEGESTQALANWWTDFQQAPAETQAVMIQSIPKGKTARSLRKRRKPKSSVANEPSKKS